MIANPLSAYSGGLDTSVILRWLVLEGYTVVCFLADVGQEDAADAKAIEEKALKLGAERMVIVDLQRQFIESVVWTAVRCNAQVEDRYLLGVCTNLLLVKLCCCLLSLVLFV